MTRDKATSSHRRAYKRHFKTEVLGARIQNSAIQRRLKLTLLTPPPTERTKNTEINATNEACSTENENATHDTWFRLSLDLHTPHDRGGSNPDSNLSFSGTTPEAFDHALATILDVVTSTVYGGQLNGLQEIIDRSTAELRADSEKAQHGAATLEDILRQEPPEDDAQQPKPKRNPALDVDTPKISTVTEPRPSFAPPLSRAPGAQKA